MNGQKRVATPPAKPTLIYDGDCRFCTLWVRRWQRDSGDAVEYLASQNPLAAEKFPEISAQEFATAVQLVETNGQVVSGAAAVFRALATNSGQRCWLRCYEAWPWFAGVTEWVYALVARNRPIFSWFTRLFYGAHVERPDYFLTRWLFLRAIGLIYLIAFLSLWTQIDGLIGSNGIQPASVFMPVAGQYFDAQKIGPDRYRQLPTLAWLSVSDTSLHVQCAAGTVLALVLIVGIAPAPCLFLLWLVYLSLSVVAREFLGFQWDILLLETGFLAIFFAPWQFWPRPANEAPPSRLALWLLRLLLFKLMFQSGCVKLLSGDPMWRNLTALTVHYETQPLPTWIGWYVHQLPMWAQKLSCLVMFGVELVVPFLIFLPRRPRQMAAILFGVLQILILLTGNYTFFNWLTLALCVLLLDDFLLAKLLPKRLRGWFGSTSSRLLHRWQRWTAVAVAVVVIPITLWQCVAMFGVRPWLLHPVEIVYRYLSPLRTVNSYGLFAVMTKTRPEIVIEGSNDGVNWLPYEFKYKPGDLARRPGFIAPHQPRLDWQMWFAALSPKQDNPWLANLCMRLLQGAKPVLGLLERNPFPNRPPRYVRAVTYEYHFTAFESRRRTGGWWWRESKGLYLPPLWLPNDAVRPAR